MVLQNPLDKKKMPTIVFVKNSAYKIRVKFNRFAIINVLFRPSGEDQSKLLKKSANNSSYEA